MNQSQKIEPKFALPVNNAVDKTKLVILDNTSDLKTPNATNGSR